MTTGLQLFSTIKQSGELELSLTQVELPEPGKGEVLVKLQAAPINPSDMWPLFGPADLTKAELKKTDAGLSLTAPIHPGAIRMMKARLDQTLPVGNEGAGEVIAAGQGAEHLIGKTVSLWSGATYAQYCCVPASVCLTLHDGTTAKEGASSFVNPMTALCMIETMRLEGHSALIHTVGASNLGQMLNKICIDENIDLINIVRSQEQVEIVQKLGAKYVLNSTSESFKQDLFNAIDETGATIAFDAIGGGELASTILSSMERVLSKDATGLNTYGSSALKQVYVYGGLNLQPTVLNRSYGMCWSLAGWLLPHCLQRIGKERAGQLQQRVADEINTTFASSYTQEITFEQALTPEFIAAYTAMKTGDKYLLRPDLG